jgi:cardiolipin synthase
MTGTRLTLANKITVGRLLSIPLLVIVLLLGWDRAALVVFAASALSDALDGLVARRLKQKTVLGSYLDPLADKLLLSSTYLVLAHGDRLPMWVFVLVFSRDVMILLGWNVIYILTRTFTVEPRWPGKAATFSQMALVLLCLSGGGGAAWPPVFWAMVAATGASMVDYVWVGAKKLSVLG